GMAGGWGVGGKWGGMVCGDANLERTAGALVWGAFANVGQACVSVERAYVHQSVHDELVRRVVEKTRKLRQGAPTGEVDMGAMTWDRQLAIVEERVAQAVSAGARLATGGKRGQTGGLFYPPTVL